MGRRRHGGTSCVMPGPSWSGLRPGGLGVVGGASPPAEVSLAAPLGRSGRPCPRLRKTRWQGRCDVVIMADQNSNGQVHAVHTLTMTCVAEVHHNRPVGRQDSLPDGGDAAGASVNLLLGFIHSHE